MTIGWPHLRPSQACRVRASTSVMPPAGTGTIVLTARAVSCAWVICAVNSVASNAKGMRTATPLAPPLPGGERSAREARGVRGQLTDLSRLTCPLTPTLSPSGRSEEHTSELQSLRHLVCRLLLEKK